MRIGNVKRIEFTISGEDGQPLSEPGFVKTCSELPIAIMRAVEDFVEAHGGRLQLPLVIHVRSSQRGPTC